MADSIITDDKNLNTVISLLQDSNAAEELTLEEVSSHRYTLASPESQNFIREVPSLLSQIGDFLKNLIGITKDVLENGSFLVRNAKEEKVEKTRAKKEKVDNAISGTSLPSFKEISDNMSKNSLLGSLVYAGSFLIGAVVGSIESFAKFFKAQWEKSIVSKWFSFMDKPIKSVKTFLSDFGTFILEGFKEMGQAFSEIIAPLKSGKLFRIFQNIGKFFSGAGGWIADAMGIPKMLAEFAGKLKFFFDLGKTIGKKIALPLTIIIALWDTVKGVIDGYKTEGIAGAFKGGISGLLNSLVGGLLDLVKDGISWLLGALGWESAEKALDSFSFSKLISDGVSAIVDMFVYYIDYIKDKFSIDKMKAAFEKYNILGIGAIIAGGILDTIKGALSWALTLLGATDWAVSLDSFSFQDLYMKVFDGITGIFDYLGEMIQDGYDALTRTLGNVGDIAANLVKSILKNVLPRANANGNWYDPQNLAATAIPESVYKFAGITSTGEEIKATPVESISVNPSSTAGAVSTNPSNSGGTTVINNISKGGDVSNVSNSNVNNTNSAASPLFTGSAIGLLYAY